eukprot:3645078-Rhodomonas_salina.2
MVLCTRYWRAVVGGTGIARMVLRSLVWPSKDSSLAARYSYPPTRVLCDVRYCASALYMLCDVRYCARHSYRPYSCRPVLYLTSVSHYT